MTLLDTITAAAAAVEPGSGSAAAGASSYPIILNPDPIFPQLSKPSLETKTLTLTPVSGWSLSLTDSKIIEYTLNLSKTLTSHLRNPKPMSSSSLTKHQFLSHLNSFFTSISEQVNVQIDKSDPSDSIRRLGFILGPEIAGLLAECCVQFQLWNILEALIVSDLLKQQNSTNLVEKLIEEKKSELICLFVKHVPDLRSSEILLILKYFLSPFDEDCYKGMVSIRKNWEKEAISVIEKATQKDLPKKIQSLAKESAILLMVALDGFSSNEICLHYLFRSNNSDELVLESSISRLDGSELLNLVKYMIKWIEKFRKFPEADSCVSAVSVLGLRECGNVPTFGSILKAFSVVLDSNFSYFVLNSEIREEIRKGEESVKCLSEENDFCNQVGEIIEQLKANKGKEED